jgi:hypothetical protein
MLLFSLEKGLFHAGWCIPYMNVSLEPILLCRNYKKRAPFERGAENIATK